MLRCAAAAGLVLGLVTSAPARAADTLSLQEAVSLGLTHAFGARIADFRVDAARAQVGAAGVAFLPELSASLSENASSTHVNPDYVFGGGLDRDNIWGSSLEADVAASYTLLSTTRRLDLKSAQLRRQGQEADSTTAKRTVVRDVARAYLQVVQSDALLRLAEQDASRRTRHLEESRALVKAGKRAEFEVIRAEAELASSEASLVEARNNARLTRSTLAQVVGKELPLDFVAETPAPPPDPRGAAADRRPMRDLVDASMKRRGDVTATELDARIARIEANRADRRFVPTLSIYGRYNRLLDAGRADPYDESISYGARLQVLFSDNLANLYRTKATRAESRLAQVVADQTRVAISLDVERASLEADRAAEVSAATKKSVDAARRNYESAAERYRLGVASQTERIDAETGLVQAEVDAARSDVGYRTALWNLRYEMGEPLEVL